MWSSGRSRRHGPSPMAPRISALRATVRAALGRHWSRVADYDLAQAVLGEALDLAGRAGASRLEAGIVRSLGLIQLSQGDLNAALETFQGSLAAARDAKDADGEAANLINVGLVLTRLGRFDEARTSLERGLVRAQDAGNRSWERNAVGNLGIVVLYSGDPETARIRFLEHVALSRELGDRLGEAQGTLNLASGLPRLGPHRGSERALRTAALRCSGRSDTDGVWLGRRGAWASSGTSRAATRKRGTTSRRACPWHARSGTGRSRPTASGASRHCAPTSAATTRQRSDLTRGARGRTRGGRPHGGGHDPRRLRSPWQPHREAGRGRGSWPRRLWACCATSR